MRQNYKQQKNYRLYTESFCIHSILTGVRGARFLYKDIELAVFYDYYTREVSLSALFKWE